MQLVFATNNSHKLFEIRKLIDKDIRIIGLKEAGIYTEIPEDQSSVEGNALQKAKFIYDHYGFNCFADDTGLEVNALNGEPGVFSARYSLIGDPVFPEMEVTEGNIHKLLLMLKKIKDRSARFRTVIALVMDGEVFMFEGKVNGTIIYEKRGNEGFGYDPVFLPDGLSKTFAEMPIEEKNLISHRAQATSKLRDFLLKMKSS